MPESECRDAERDWFPQRTICYRTMAANAANDRYDRKHEARPWHNGTFESWAKDWDEEHPFHYRWGVNVWVSTHDLSPDDEFI